MDVWLRPTWEDSSTVLKNGKINNIYIFPENKPVKYEYNHVINTHWSMMNRKFGDIKTVNNPYKHEIENYMQAAYLLGYKGGIPEQWVGNMKWHGSVEGKTIGIHSGCFGGVWEKKKWNGFQELASRLALNGYNVYNYGKKNESLSEIEFSSGQLIDYTRNNTSLSSTIESMSKCDYFIANDSGLMHISDALGIPTIAIFGPTLITKNRPVNPNSLTIQATKGWKQDCIPCQYTENFNLCAENQCLQNINAKFVFEQFIKLRGGLKDGVQKEKEEKET